MEYFCFGRLPPQLAERRSPPFFVTQWKNALRDFGFGQCMSDTDHNLDHLPLLETKQKTMAKDTHFWDFRSIEEQKLYSMYQTTSKDRHYRRNELGRYKEPYREENQSTAGAKQYPTATLDWLGLFQYRTNRRHETRKGDCSLAPLNHQ